MATIAETAAHLDLSERRIYELQDKGVLPKAARGQISLDGARVAYIRHLREGASGRATPGELDPAQERARKDRALAIATELKNDIAQGNVVPITVAIATQIVAYRNVRNKMLAFPTRLAARTPQPVRDQVFALAEAEVEQILTELSTEARVTGDEVQAELKQTGEAA